MKNPIFQKIIKYCKNVHTGLAIICNRDIRIESRRTITIDQYPLFWNIPDPYTKSAIRRVYTGRASVHAG